MEGRLKQKLQGVDGILCWRLRHFVLDVRARSIDVTDTSEGFVESDDGNISNLAAAMPGVGGGKPDFGARLSVTRVSLEGARHAVAWSGINAFNGCGFDLVWASGRVWSLLCDDPLSRKSWVDALNLCLREPASVSPGVLGQQRALTRRGAEEGGPSDRRTSNRRQLRPESSSSLASTTTSTRGRPSAESPPSPPPPLQRRSKDIPGAGVSYPALDLNNTEENKALPAGGGGGGGGEKDDGHLWSSFDGKKGEQSGESLSSSEWAHVGAVVAGVLDTTFDEGQGQRQRHRRMRPRRREATAERPGQAYSNFSRAGVSSPGAGLAAPRASDGRPAARETTVAETRQGDEEEAINEGVDSSSCEGGVRYGKGKKGGGRSKVRERSEQLAKASAATWDQFQQLLEKSRQSKARFDRVMDGASETAAAAAAAGAKSASRPRPLSDGKRHGGNHGGAVKDSGSAPPGFPAGVEGSQPHATVATAAAVAPILPEGRGTTASSVSASSPDRLSPSAPTTCAVSDDGCGGASGGAITSKAVALGAHTGARVRNSDVAGAAEESRLSALADVEASLPLEARERVTSEDGKPSEGDGSSDVEGSREGRHRRYLLKPLSRTELVAPRHDGPTCSTDIANHDRDDSTMAAATATAVAAAARASRLEEELEVARSEAAARAEKFLRLERDLATALAANVSADTAEDEGRRLRSELKALKAASREEREKERAEANARAAVVERERDRVDAAATAEAAVAAAAMKSKVNASLAGTLEAKERAKREKAEAVRQKDELEKVLAAEIKERRRVSDLLEASSRSEISLRERLEATAGEGDLKARLTSARSKLESVSLERDALAEELDQCIGRLGDQAREVAAALRSRQQREIAEISSRCEVEKEAIREQVALEADERSREHTRSTLLGQERRLKAEAAGAARREAKLRDKQVREAKAESEAAGAATRKDIEKLRGLHARRVKRLETLLREEGERLANARREIAACKATLAGNAGEFQRWTEGQQDQSNRLLEELARIQKKVNGAVAMEGEAREREALAMGRLRTVMEEARLERAEGVEVRRQLREALAELESDRNAQARRARTDVQLQRAAEIAQQEVAMLEAESVRWHEERRCMEEALDRLTRLVYGPGSTNTAMNNTMPSRSTPTCTWKPAGGGKVKAAAAARGGQTKPRAACSPIGVNVASRGSKRVVLGGGRR